MSLQRFYHKNRNKGIPYLPFVIVGCFLIGYLLYYTESSIYYKLTLNPYMILKRGEVWRLFTWLVTIPFSLRGINAIFMPINMLFYLWLGFNLEKIMGRLVYNIFIIGQILVVDMISLILGLYEYVLSSSAEYSDIYMMMSFGKLKAADYIYVSGVTHYMCVSIFLLFALLFTEQVILLYFILPIKMKWLAYVDLFFLAYDFIRISDLQNRGVIISMVIHFVLFYLIVNRMRGVTREMRKRQRTFRDAVRQGERLHGQNRGAGRSSGWQYREEGQSNGRSDREEKIARLRPATTALSGDVMHRCSICGRTEKDAPDLEFRYCSKCNGNFEYCTDHLFTHEHRS